jgi:hypothetical protein
MKKNKKVLELKGAETIDENNKEATTSAAEKEEATTPGE